MHLDLVFLCQANFHEEFRDIGPLVSLKLDHLAILRVVNHRPIASKFLWVTTCVHELCVYVCVCVCVCVCKMKLKCLKIGLSAVYVCECQKEKTCWHLKGYLKELQLHVHNSVNKCTFLISTIILPSSFSYMLLSTCIHATSTSVCC